MGRHSTPGDDEDGDVLVATPVPAVSRGRHARPEDNADNDPGGPPETAPSSAPRTKLRAPRPGKGDQSTAADLDLLRERSDVRARVIAAVLIPFVIYTAALFVLDRANEYLIWVWLPLVTAGVLAGSILDAAHRKRERDGSR